MAAVSLTREATVVTVDSLYLELTRDLFEIERDLKKNLFETEKRLQKSLHGLKEFNRLVQYSFSNMKIMICISSPLKTSTFDLEGFS